MQLLKGGFVCLMVLLLLGLGGVSAQDDAVSIIFMHHSTGLGVIEEGNIRAQFTDLGYDFWDHGYNEEGLTAPDGEMLGINWDVPGDNTDPDGWYEIFNQPFTDPPTNTFSQMLQHDVIIFKSCFPSSDIADDAMLEQYRDYYLSIRDVMDQHPDKIFIPWTTPPLVPNSTTAENAARAKQWAAYLTSDDYLDGHPNVFVFDINSLWSDDEGYLRAEFRQDEWDSHPNTVANQTVGPIFVNFVDEVVQNFVPGEPVVRPVLPEVDVVDDQSTADDDSGMDESGDEAAVAPAVAVQPGDMIEDFEAGYAVCSERWWHYSDVAPEPAYTFIEPGYESAFALQVDFDIAQDHYGGFGTDFLPPQDWSAAEGLRFMWMADQAGYIIVLNVWVDNPTDADDPTPFEIHLEPPAGAWGETVVLWDDLIKPDWIGDSGVAAFDPAHITMLSFDIGGWAGPQAGTLWLDDVQLVGQ